MPFKLSDLSKNIPAAKQPPPAQEKQVISAPESQPAKPTPPPKQMPSLPKIGGKERVMLPLPYQIAHFVIFATGNGKASMKQCASEKAAKELVQKLEAGYVGN